VLSDVDSRRTELQVIVASRWADKLRISNNVVVFAGDVDAVGAEEWAAGVVEDVVLKRGLCGLAGTAKPGTVDRWIWRRTADDVVDEEGVWAAGTVGIGSGIDLGDTGALRSTAYRGRDVVNDGVVGDQDGNPG